MWEMPPFHNHQHQPPPAHPGFDRVSDPLGINQNGPPAGSNNGPMQQPGVKRRPSEEGGGHPHPHQQAPPPKKLAVVAGPWDLEIATNVILYEKPPSLLPHPHPDVEQLRFTYAMKLRQSFQELCHSREGTDIWQP